MKRTDDDCGRQAPVVELSLHHRESDILLDLVKLPEHGPVARIPHGDYAWIVSDPVLARSVLKDGRFSKEGRHAPTWAASNIITSEGDEHARLRKLHMLAFSPARTQTWSAIITSVIDELLHNLEHRAGAATHNTPVDVVSGLAYPLPLTIICTLLGLPRDVHPVMRNASEDISYGGNAAVRTRGREQLFGTVAELIDHCLDRLADSLITDLIDLTRNDPPQATLTETRTAISAFLRRFPDARLANPDAPATWQSDLTSRRIVSLPVILSSS